MGQTSRLVDCAECGEHKLHQARGMCGACYQRLRLEGKLTIDYARHGGDLKVRLLSKVAMGPDGCWIYTGKPSDENYCRIQVGQNDKRKAHRLSYELFVGAIPDGYHIDHTCHSRHPTCTATKTCHHRRCVNPDHLEPVSPSEHGRRTKHSDRPRRVNAEGTPTHCTHGHEMSGDNVVPRGADRPGLVECRTCRLDRGNRARTRRREMTADFALSAARRDSARLHDPLAAARVLDQLAVAQAILSGLLEGVGASGAPTDLRVHRAALVANAALVGLIEIASARRHLRQVAAA